MAERLTRVEICSNYLNCNPAYLNNIISKSGAKKDFPKSGIGKRYDVVSVLKFVEKYGTGKIKEKASSSLLMIMSSEKKESETKAEGKKKPSVKEKENVGSDELFDIGKKEAKKLLPAELQNVNVPKPDVSFMDYSFNRNDDYYALLEKFGCSVGKMFENLGLAISSGDIAMQASISNVLSKLVSVLGTEQARSIEMRQKIGSLMEKDDVKEIVSRLCTNIKSKLMMLPSKLAPELIGIESQQRVREILEQEITEVLVGLRDNPFGD